MNVLKEHAFRPISIYSTNREPVNLYMEEKHNFSSDEEIWTAFKAGDERAYEFMFKEHYAFLLNYGLKFNSNEEDIKDCIQQLFAGLWESRKRLGKNNSIRSYLLASLRRMILRGAKSKLKFLDISNFYSSFHLNHSVENKFLKTQTEKEQVSHLSKLISNLPKRQKEAVYLKYYGEHSFKEIAEIMGISTRVVYKMIYKALNNLSSQIGDKKNTFDLL